MGKSEAFTISGEEGTVCQKCGVVGYPEHLIFCSQCKVSAEHRYCMDVMPNRKVVEVLWSCHECLFPLRLDQPAAVIAAVPLKKRSGSPMNKSSGKKKCLNSIHGEKVNCGRNKKRPPVVNKSGHKRPKKLSTRSADKMRNTKSFKKMEEERERERTRRRKLILDDDSLLDEEMEHDNVGQASVDKENQHDNGADICEIGQPEEQLTANSSSSGEEMEHDNVDQVSVDKENQHDNGSDICEIAQPEEELTANSDQDVSFGEWIGFAKDSQTFAHKDSENVAVLEVYPRNYQNSVSEHLAAKKITHLEEIPVESKDQLLSSHKENEQQNCGHICNIAQSAEQVAANKDHEVSRNDWIEFDANSRMCGNAETKDIAVSEVLPIDNGNHMREHKDIDRIGEDHGYVYSDPIVDPVWRGCFAINPINHYRIAAHLSTKACDKVCEEARKLTTVLSLEKLTKARAWPSRFSKCPPNDDDIALYFFPECQRDDAMFDKLVDELNKSDLFFRATLDSSELLIFSSRLLPKNYWLFHGRFYMWGIFRARQMDQLKLTSGRSSTVKDGHKDSVRGDSLSLPRSMITFGIGSGTIASSESDRSQPVSEGSVENLTERESSSGESTNGCPSTPLNTRDKHESNSISSVWQDIPDWRSGDKLHSSELMPASLFGNFVFHGKGNTGSWNYESTVEDCDVSYNISNPVLTLFPLGGEDMAVVNKLDRHSVINLELGLGSAVRKDGSEKLLI